MFHKTIITKYIAHSIKIGFLLTIAITVPACKTNDLLRTSQTYTEGYVVDPAALKTISVGSNRDQILLALGFPSTTAIFDSEVFYYISQTRYRRAQFMKPKVIDRSILAIYFNNQGQVKKIANYGLQDSKLFDFVSRTTPIQGKEQSFLIQLIKGVKAVPATGLPIISR